MKKSLKRFLIISQALGWSALLASACTDEQVKTISQNTTSPKNNQTKSQADSSNTGTNSESVSIKTGTDSTKKEAQGPESPTSQGDTQHSEKNGPQVQDTKESSLTSSNDSGASTEPSGLAAKPNGNNMSEETLKSQKEKEQEEQSKKAKQAEAEAEAERQKTEKEAAEKKTTQEEVEKNKKMQESSGSVTPGVAGEEGKGTEAGMTPEHPSPSQSQATSQEHETTEQISH